MAAVVGSKQFEAAAASSGVQDLVQLLEAVESDKQPKEGPVQGQEAGEEGAVLASGELEAVVEKLGEVEPVPHARPVEEKEAGDAVTEPASGDPEAVVKLAEVEPLPYAASSQDSAGPLETSTELAEQAEQVCRFYNKNHDLRNPFRSSGLAGPLKKLAFEGLSFL